MVVLVLTGCSSGLGAKVLVELAHSLPIGSTILSGYRSSTPPSLPVQSRPGTHIEWIPLDLASLASVDNFVQKVKQLVRSHGSGGGIDCVLLNAATWNNSFKPTTFVTSEMQSETWAEEFLVNHRAQFRLVKDLVPFFTPPPSTSALTRSRSRIVFTSSSLQNSLRAPITSIEKAISVLREPDDSQSQARIRYASSKLIQSLAFYHLERELVRSKQAIDIVGVSPGFVPTTGLSRDSPWWQRFLMKWVVYYLPFSSTEIQGTRKILEALNYLLPSNPFPSELDQHLDRLNDSPTEIRAGSPEVPQASARLVFHPESLAPTASRSDAGVYEEIKLLVQGRQVTSTGEASGVPVATLEERWERLARKIMT